MQPPNSIELTKHLVPQATRDDITALKPSTATGRHDVQRTLALSRLVQPLSTLVTQVTVQADAGCQKAVTRTGQVLLFVCCRQASYTAGAIVGGIAAAGGRCECSRRSGHLGIASSCQVKPLCRFRGPADTRGRRQPPGQGDNCLMIIQDQHHRIGISTTAYHCVGISTTVMGSAPL